MLKYIIRDKYLSCNGSQVETTIGRAKHKIHTREYDLIVIRFAKQIFQKRRENTEKENYGDLMKEICNAGNTNMKMIKIINVIKILCKTKRYRSEGNKFLQ